MKHLKYYALNDDGCLWTKSKAAPKKRVPSKLYFTNYVIPHCNDDDEILLVNTLSGAVDYIDGATLEELSDIISGRLSIPSADKLRKHLYKRGYIFASRREEREAWRFVVDRYSKYDSDYNFLIYLTTACNFACTYCFQNKMHYKSETMDRDALASSLKFIALYAKDNNIPPSRVKIVLFGGEPLLPSLRDHVEAVFKEAKRRKWKIAVVTNGYTIDEYAPLLKRYKSSIEYMQISIDGTERVHNARRMLKGGKSTKTFRRVVKNVDFLNASGIPCLIKVNVDESNMRHLDNFQKYIKKKGWDRNRRFQFAVCSVYDYFYSKFYRMPLESHVRLMDRSKTAAQSAPLVNRFREALEMRSGKIERCTTVPLIKPCPPTDLAMMILNVDSHIYPCVSIAGKTKYSIGRFHPKPRLSKRKSRMWAGRSIEHQRRCRNCVMAFFCGGSCPVRSLMKKGDINEPTCVSPAGIEEVLIRYLDAHRDRIRARLKSLKPTLSIKI